MTDPIGNCECGAPLAETGPPIWETYCTDEKCKVAWNKLVKAIREAPLPPLTGRYAAEIKQIAAELRHTYDHLVNGTTSDPAELARGLLGPQIVRLEKLTGGK
jgi:hypothetical protein